MQEVLLTDYRWRKLPVQVREQVLTKLHKDEVVTTPPISLHEVLQTAKNAKINRASIQSLKMELERIAGVGA